MSELEATIKQEIKNNNNSMQNEFKNIFVNIEDQDYFKLAAASVKIGMLLKFPSKTEKILQVKYIFLLFT